MNPNQLYSDLMELCKPDDSPFFYVDHRLGENLYRVFTYRLAQYSDYLKPGALECRGHMFQIREDGSMTRLAALPMHKFFNYNENPFTMDLDLSSGADLIMDKMDGSLISSYVDIPAKLRLKSKTALESDQANGAMNYLASNKALYNFVEIMTGNDYTVNMEYTSPQFRIVVPHQHDNLTVLNVRKISTGAYLPHAKLKTLMEYHGVAHHLVRTYEVEDFAAWLASVPAMDGNFEGFVFRLPNGTWAKVKTEKYMALHHAKSSVDSAKALFAVVVNEASDDLKAQFPEDAFLIARIEEMESKVAAIYTTLKVNVVNFYNENRHLARKDYALKGQAELDRSYFGLAMSLYLDKEPNFKEWLLKHRIELGVKDDPVALDIEG